MSNPFAADQAMTDQAVANISTSNRKHYVRPHPTRRFDDPEKEIREYAAKNSKKCSKCHKEKCLLLFAHNTSGRCFRPRRLSSPSSSARIVKRARTKVSALPKRLPKSKASLTRPPREPAVPSVKQLISWCLTTTMSARFSGDISVTPVAGRR